MPRKQPDRYEYLIKTPERASGNAAALLGMTIRVPLLSYLKTAHPKFLVCGFREGLISELLGSSRDIAFRQCLGTTPIVCKAKHTFRQEVDDNENKVYGTTTLAFKVDWTKDALFAFNLMTDHFKKTGEQSL